MSTVKETVDVNVPVRRAYDQWTQFEEFPRFMEGVEEVTQLDDRHNHWTTKIAGVKRECDTEIVDQLVDDRVTWRTVGGDEVTQRRAAALDGMREDALHFIGQHRVARPGHLSRGTHRRDARGEQGLGRVDVAHAHDDALVHQERLHRCGAPAAACKQPIAVERIGQRLRSQALQQFMCPVHWLPQRATEAPRVVEAQHAGTVERDVEMVVPACGQRRGQHAQAAAHSQVQQCAARVRVEQQVLRAPPHRRDPATWQQGLQLRRERPAQAGAPLHHPGDGVPDQVRRQATAGGFDFGQFGHGQAVARGARTTILWVVCHRWNRAVPIKSLIRTIPDFPRPGIQFRDITTLLANPVGFARAINDLADRYRDGEREVDLVAGIEARGFIIGAALALALGKGFIPIRKAAKLPGQTLGQDYKLEYGSDRVEIHADALAAGARVLLVDDLVATGGTAEAASLLVAAAGGRVVECAFVIDLPDLGGRRRLEAQGLPVHALCAFEGG